MGILGRMTTVIKARLSKVLDRAEDPRESLDYSYERQLELLRGVKRGMADVVTSKKRLELQAVKLKQNVEKLEVQARDAMARGREDLARLALERKHLALEQISGLDEQVKALEHEQEKLAATEARLQTKVESFRTQKEVIKAQYSAAEAQVKIGESATGLSEEMADVGLAVQRAQDKTEQMKARAAAIDELVALGTLEDNLSGDDIDRELRRLSAAAGVEADLKQLRQEVNKS